MTTTSNSDPFDQVDRLPEVLHRWHELTDHEQQAVARLVNRIASQPLNWYDFGPLTRIRLTSTPHTVGIEVTTR